ncbi:hypothetical protein KM043_017141 [Ampulex compressa]|nr:hypothetical protein KM043_017141 [Ampulex compressa]
MFIRTNASSRANVLSAPRREFKELPLSLYAKDSARLRLCEASNSGRTRGARCRTHRSARIIDPKPVRFNGYLCPEEYSKWRAVPATGHRAKDTPPLSRSFHSPFLAPICRQ